MVGIAITYEKVIVQHVVSVGVQSYEIMLGGIEILEGIGRGR